MFTGPGRHVLRCWSPDSACNFSWPSSGKTSDAGRKRLAQQHCAGGDVFDQRGSVNFRVFFIYIYTWIIPYIMENKIHVWNHQPVLYIYTHNIIWMVVYLPLWKIWKSNWIIIPTIGQNKSHVPKRQPVVDFSYHPNIGDIIWYNLQIFESDLKEIPKIGHLPSPDKGQNEKITQSMRHWLEWLFLLSSKNDKLWSSWSSIHFSPVWDKHEESMVLYGTRPYK